MAVSGRTRLSVPAFCADVLHTHCAGAALSGGLIDGLLHDWPMQDCIDLAGASGTLRCERMHDDPRPALGELREFMGSWQRVAAPAA